MEIFGGFMAMASIFGFLLAVVWLILPFVVFAIKAKVDRSFLLLEEIDRRLAEVERQLKRSAAVQAAAPPPSTPPDSPSPH